MNVKKRLIIFNTITIIIPFIVVALAMFVFLIISPKFFRGDINYDKFKELASTKYELLNMVNNISNSSYSSVEDPEFQRYLTQKLSTINGDVIISRDRNVIFKSKDINKIDIEKCLEEVENSSFKNSVNINNVSYMIDSVPVKYKNNSTGHIILLAPISAQWDTAKKLIIFVISLFFVSFIIVNILMSYLFSKRILNPISSLKKAAAEISRGDLEFEIIEDGDEEIRELCADFEKMRVQLKDSIRLKIKYDDNRKMLVSSISHDLKTPITSIKGYVEGILDGIANTPEKLHRYLTTIYSKSEQIDIMIDDLLLYSKLDLNQIPFNFEKTDIVEYFDYCIQENEPLLQKSNIEINLKNDLVNSKYVMIDRERLRRVIVNIIDNSKKYMNKSFGKIDILLRETNSSIIIEMRDNGSGISKDHINKIFNRFYRADAARSGTKGSGLGLAIAKQIVEGHKGKIWAVSHESEGTSIIISLAKITHK